MERTQILVIAGAFVVVVFVGYQMFSSSDAGDGMPLSRARSDAGVAGGDDEGDSGGSGDGRYASSGRSGGESGTRSGRSAGTGLGSNRREGREGGSGTRSGSTALASRGERGGGTVGSGSRVGGGSVGGSAMFDRGGSRQLGENGAPRRSDVVEYLASQPASAGRSRDRESGETDENVALELKRPEDADTAGVKKEVEAPDASDEGLTFTEGSVLAFPDGGNVNGDAGTISFEIEPNWNGNDETNNSLVTLRSEHGWSNRIELVKNGRYLRFILADNMGREADISVPIDAWTPGEGHDVQATWGGQKTALYIDGVKVGENTYTEFVRPDAPLYIGSDHRGSSYSGLNGTVKNFKVTNSSSLSPQS